MTRQLMKGNEAVVHGALLGGATHFFGYPITPASEITQAAAWYFPQTGRHFLQAESEVSAINMVYGAAAAGSRVMTASSGPGMSLMAEGLSYMAGAELPCVIVDIQRAGPGLGNVWPEQSDYNQIVKGAGHGNYKNVVFAPFSAQEMCDFTYRSFEIADEYRVTVIILADGCIGQMMEPVTLPETVKHGRRSNWAVYADHDSRPNLITSIHMNQHLQSEHNLKLQEKYARLERERCEYEETDTDDADVVYVAFGISARLCLSAVRELRRQGKKVGLLRPKTLCPFPSVRLEALGHSAKAFIVVELNTGQMVDDVSLATKNRVPVLKYNWCGGIVPSCEEIVERTETDLSRLPL